MNIPKKASALIVAAIAALSCTYPPATADSDGRDLIHRCSTHEISRRQLRVNANTTVYVEPQALAASEERVLIAGTPNYTWTAPEGDGGGSLKQNSVLGVILSESLYARELRAPIDANRIRTVRAVTRKDGTWAIVFAEMSPRTATDSIARLWFGIHDGLEWQRLVQIPFRDDGNLRLGSVSRLALGDGDTLAFTVPLRIATYDDLAVFTYDGTTWTHELIPTRRAAYADLAFSVARKGWIIAVVRPDTTVPRDVNSLFLYHKVDGEWSVLRKIDSGRTAPIHHPSLRLGSHEGASTLGWLAVVTTSDGRQRLEARVAPDPLGDAVLVARIDSTAENAIPVGLREGTVVWITDHNGTDGKSIRFFQATGSLRRMEEFGRVPNDFEGQFGALALPTGGILLSGPLMEVSGETITSLSSRIVHVDVRCTPAN